MFNIGFSPTAFQGLMNYINSDNGMFFYYGSETTPPCREEVLWMVFAEPRAISPGQQEFLRKQLGKYEDASMNQDKESSKGDITGNLRSLFSYNVNKNGHLWFNQEGVRGLKYPNIFSEI